MKKIYILLLLVCVTALSNAQESFQKLDELTAPNRVKMDHFGFSVAASGNYAIVGARYKDKDPTKNYTEEGAAYIYEKAKDGKWNLAQKLEASDAVSGRGFGKVVDLFGDYAVVGDHFGYTYIYERSSDGVWKEKKKLPRHGGKYKYVSLSNNWLAVGQDYKKKGNTKFYNGSVHLYKRDSLGNWDKAQKITLLDTLNENHFGLEVSVSEQHLFVRSDFNIHIYALNLNNVWDSIQTLPVGLPDKVGHALSTIKVNDNTAVIGMHSLSNQVNLGNVHVYKLSPDNNIWALQKTLVAFDSVGTGIRDFGFGYSVDLFGKHILVGSNSTGLLEKNAYVFHQADSGWFPKQKIALNDPTALNFGNAVAIAGNNFFVAAERQGADSVEASTPKDPYRAGKVYIYGDPTPPLCETIAIPDRNFEQALLDLGIDTTDGRLNGVICKVDAEAVKYLFVNDKNISDFSGIAYFKNLERFDCSSNNIKELDLSSNKLLININCRSNNSLIKVNIQNSENENVNLFNATNSPRLKCIQVDSIQFAIAAGWDKDLTATYSLNCDTLICDFVSIPDPVFENKLIKLNIDKDGVINKKVCVRDVQSLDSLDVSANQEPNKITDFSGIEAFTNLKYLNCSGNNLKTINLENNTLLRSLLCSVNNLDSLNLKTNTSLEYLDCSGNNNLSILNLKENKLLRELLCNNIGIETLDLKENKFLEILGCGNNYLAVLDLKENTGLRLLACGDNHFSSLDLSNNAKLEALICQDSENLVFLNLQNNNNERIQSLDVKNNPSLTCIQVDHLDSAKTQVNTNKWKKDTTAIFHLDCFNPCKKPIAIPDIAFEKHLIAENYDSDGVVNGQMCEQDADDIKTLKVSNSQIKDFTGIESFTNLMNLHCDSNQLINLDLSRNTALQYLDCSNNNFTTLNLEKNMALQTLHCYNNDLVTLNLEKNMALQTLYCYNNDLVTLNLEKNTDLQTLHCYNNDLTTLNLETNTVLQDFTCTKNPIKTLDLRTNIALKKLICNFGDFDTLNLSSNNKLEAVFCNDNQNLKFLNVANGNNIVLEQLNAASTGLKCIQVDNVADSDAKIFWQKDSGTEYKTFCSTFSPSPNQNNPAHNPTDNVIVYPNPVTKGQLFINTSQEIYHVVIYNMKGEEAFAADTNLKQIDIAGLDRGFYMVKITLVDEVVNKKVVVE